VGVVVGCSTYCKSKNVFFGSCAKPAIFIQESKRHLSVWFPVLNTSKSKSLLVRSFWMLANQISEGLLEEEQKTKLGHPCQVT